jgi:hypothetical protein
VTVGSRGAVSVAGCDAAVPLRDVADSMAIVDDTKKLNEDFMTILPKDGQAVSMATSYHTNIQLAKISEFGLVEEISSDLEHASSLRRRHSSTTKRSAFMVSIV